MANVILMPAVVADAEDAVLTAWLVAKGDQVKKGQPLAEIETDKANVEVNADSAGTVGVLLAEAGERVAVGSPICVLLRDGEDDSAIDAALGVEGEAATGGDAVSSPAGAAKATAQAPGSSGGSAESRQSQQTAGSPARQPGERVFASPLARRIAAEHGLDIARIPGRGPRGRVVRADVEAALEAGAAQAEPRTAVAAEAAAGPAAAAGYQDLPLSRMRKAIARRLTESKSTVPHFYVTMDARMDELLAFRTQVNAVSPVKVSVNDLVIKAIAGALMAVPEANAIWNTETIRRFSSADIAIAVATDTGLITPVVRGVEKLSLPELASATKDLATRGREGKLKQDEIEGGSFSISNMGMFGVREFSAILNPPQSGILAVGAAEQRPVVVAGELQVATVMTMTLSCDHRVVDGALGAQLLGAIKQRLEQPLMLVL